ncbi:MAG: hypothetical protein PSV35_04260 [bacterium]|nr:hypothetical protein [bacterium]
MNKLLIAVLFKLIIFSSITANAHAIVMLNASGTIAPTSSLTISLSGLVPAASYSVVCYLTSNYPFHYILLDSYLTSNASKIIAFSLNGNYVTQDQLLMGTNLMVIDGTFANPTTDTLLITNLDQTNSLTVSKCFAIPLRIAQVERSL